MGERRGTICAALSGVFLFATWPLFWAMCMGLGIDDRGRMEIGFAGLLLRASLPALSAGLALAAAFPEARLPWRGKPFSAGPIAWVPAIILAPFAAVALLEIAFLFGFYRSGAFDEEFFGRLTGWMTLLLYWVIAWGIAIALWIRRSGWTRDAGDRDRRA